MYQYSKQILTISQQVQTYIDAGMIITDKSAVEENLKSIGYFRLRGYFFHLYDNLTKKYSVGTKIEVVASRRISLSAMNLPNDWKIHLNV